MLGGMEGVESQSGPMDRYWTPFYSGMRLHILSYVFRRCYGEKSNEWVAYCRDTRVTSRRAIAGLATAWAAALGAVDWRPTGAKMTINRGINGQEYESYS